MYRDPGDSEGVGGHRGDFRDTLEPALRKVHQARKSRRVSGLKTGDIERQAVERLARLGTAGREGAHAGVEQFGFLGKVHESTSRAPSEEPAENPRAAPRKW